VAQGSGDGRGSVERLQREADQQMREAQQLAEQMQRENPGMQKGGSTPEQWQRSMSAPGTEAFKQDFAKWDELKKNLLVALEQTESKLSDQLRARETRERLNAGRHDAVGDTYRSLVDRYYQSLAAPRRQNR
jgi:small-conductance mechanosensitive channel